MDFYSAYSCANDCRLLKRVERIELYDPVLLVFLADMAYNEESVVRCDLNEGLGGFRLACDVILCLF